MSYLPVIVSALALALAAAFALGNRKIVVQSERIKELSGYIRSGAMAFLTWEYKVVAIFVVVMAVILLDSAVRRLAGGPLLCL